MRTNWYGIADQLVRINNKARGLATDDNNESSCCK